MHIILPVSSYPKNRTAGNHPSETPVMTMPITTITAADNTGSPRIKGLWELRCRSGTRFLAKRTTSPVAIRTIARPTLNDNRSVIPKPGRPSEMQVRSRISAAGHGTIPPLAPNAIRLPIVMSPSGT